MQYFQYLKVPVKPVLFRSLPMLRFCFKYIGCGGNWSQEVLRSSESNFLGYLFKTEKCIVTGPSQTSRLLIHIHCVQRAAVLESLIPLHLVHSTVQQLLRYGEGYCHVNRHVSTVIKQSNHCLLSKWDDVIRGGGCGTAGDCSGFCFLESFEEIQNELLGG